MLGTVLRLKGMELTRLWYLLSWVGSSRERGGSIITKTTTMRSVTVLVGSKEEEPPYCPEPSWGP